ncbi:MAG: DUF1576 domain-containing protein [Tyzzerella sp.]|uniref:DUF1576 domain-containing protein n=1 Tax=Candidatus Fimicola merdigallinarum TaxID=2840819 RepID=A0A9D9DW09_9FIRM|nr:DUF1576 domain-containing protein [Candidatus Fimicola merdigallinarum]
MNKNSNTGYRFAFVYAVFFVIVGFLLSSPRDIFDGFIKIILANDILITDYFYLVGIGPTLVNVGVVTLITVIIMYLNKVPLNGGGILTIGLMSGFSFFGKNVFNMWFIILGTYIFCITNKEKFSKYVVISLLSTALGPLISTTFFYNENITLYNAITSISCGIIIGFVMPLLAQHTDKLLHGLSLYNGGFAIGLLALILVPILKSYGYEFNTVSKWSVGHNFEIGSVIYLICILLIVYGFLSDRENAFTNYKNILKRSGSPTQDFTVLDGIPSVLINIGVNGIIATTYIIITGGDLNGPTIGGIITIMGFGAKGKHAKNIIPIMLGILIGGFTKEWGYNSPSAQLAGLFGTTLAPVAGTYGFLAGVFSGFVHSSVTLHAGLGYSGVNLYNNGFAGGIVSIVMFPILSRYLKPNVYSDPSPSMMMSEFKNIDDISKIEERLSKMEDELSNL